MSQHHQARWGLFQICLAGVLWGTGGLGVQLIREREAMSVVTISAWRMLIAAVALAAVVLLLRQTRRVVVLARARPVRAALVGTGTACYQALYFGAVVATGVTVATVVSLGFAPVLLTVVESIRQRRRPTTSRLLVLVAALSGLSLVSLTSRTGETGPHVALGVLLAIGSGTAYAVATELGRPLAQLAGPLALTMTTTTVGAVVLVPFGLLASAGDDPLVSGDPAVVAILLYLGVVTMALAYGLLYAGLRTTTGSAAVIATLLEPVTAAAAAAVVLEERLGALGVVGTLMILAAVPGLGGEEEPVSVPPPAWSVTKSPLVAGIRRRRVTDHPAAGPVRQRTRS
jgi:DME family drug/metabolite transporter